MTKVKIVLLQKKEYHVNAKNKSTIIYIMKFIIYSKLNKILDNTNNTFNYSYITIK